MAVLLSGGAVFSMPRYVTSHPTHLHQSDIVLHGTASRSYYVLLQACKVPSLAHTIIIDDPSNLFFQATHTHTHTHTHLLYINASQSQVRTQLQGQLFEVLSVGLW